MLDCLCTPECLHIHVAGHLCFFVFSLMFLAAYVDVCLHLRMLACLHACVLARLYACMIVRPRLNACVLACMYPLMHLCLGACVPTCQYAPICLFASWWCGCFPVCLRCILLCSCACVCISVFECLYARHTHGACLLFCLHASVRAVFHFASCYVVLSLSTHQVLRRSNGSDYRPDSRTYFELLV